MGSRILSNAPKSILRALRTEAQPAKIKSPVLYILKEIFTFIGKLFSAPFTTIQPSFKTINAKELEKAKEVAKCLPDVLENLPKDFSEETISKIPADGKILYTNYNETDTKTGQKNTSVQLYKIICKYQAEDKKTGTPAAYKIIAQGTEATEEITLATIPNLTVNEYHKNNSNSLFGANRIKNENNKSCLQYYREALKQYVGQSNKVIAEHEKKDTENQRNRKKYI